MASRKKPTEDPRFEKAWDDVFFHKFDHPFYKEYKHLCAAGADFDYVRFLYLVFISVERRLTPRSYGDQLRQSRKRIAKAVSKNGFTLEVLAREMVKLCFLVDYNFPAMVILAQTAAIQEQLFKHDPQTVKLFLKIVQTLFQMGMETKNRVIVEATQESPEARLAVFLMDKAMNEVCEKFLLLPKKGRQPDLLGSFILFAVSEHLREKGCGRSRHALAAEFLRGIRSGSKTTAASARVRVHRNPLNELLAFVNQQYLFFRALRRFARQIDQNATQTIPL